MRVIIDARPLLEPRGGGVPHYANHVIRELLARRAQEYALFCNARGRDLALPPDAERSGADLRIRRIPNRLLNAGFAFLGAPTIESLAGGGDAVYLPNLNFVATKKPLIATVHDLSFVRYPRFFSAKQRLWHRCIRPDALLARAVAVIAVSRHTKADIIETYGVPSERIHVASPGVDARYAPQTAEAVAAARAKYGLPERFFLYLGTIEPRKNVAGIVAAFSRLRGATSLVIAGGRGWLYEDVFRLAGHSPRRDRIRFTGYVDEADKPALLAAATALVYPSFYEGFGLPPLEAMAAGTPVIASHATSLGEVVGDAGMLVDPRNTAEIASAMEAIESDEKLRTLLRDRGIERAKRFTWTASAKALEEVFERLE